MTISLQGAARLRQAGFLDAEISAIAEAKTAKGEDQPPVDLSSEAWQMAIESRRDWIIDKIGRGWTETEIRRELENYYRRDKRRNPWDFLEAEYDRIMRRKAPGKSDYMAIVAKRVAARIAGELEGYKL